MAIKWTVLMTKPKQELVAEQNLKAQQFQTYLPLSPKYNRSNKVDGQCPMFPGYCFVGFGEEQSIAPLRSTIGVLAPVRFGGKVSIVEQSMMDLLRHAEQCINESVNETNIKVGDRIQINSGPLKGLEALTSKVARDRVEVLLQMIGKQHRITLEANNIKIL